MQVTINGDTRNVSDGLTVTALLALLDLPSDRLAIERNRAVLPRLRWAATPVEPGDTFEIVQLVGGG